MKLRKNLLAVAVGLTTLSPAISFADDHTEADVYASLRLGIESYETEGEPDDTKSEGIVSKSSRFGIKGKTEIDYGLTAFGTYEYGFDAANSGNDDFTRQAFIGLEGDFGKVWMGTGSHTYYNFIVSGADWPWWNSAWAMIQYRFRTTDTLSYYKSFGTVEVGASLLMDPDDAEEETIDETELGVAATFGSTKVGAGYISFAADDVEDVVGLSVSSTVGPVSLAGNYQMQEVNDIDYSGLVLNAAVKGFYAHYEKIMADEDDVAEPSSITLGYSRSLGDNTTIWAEVLDYDSDADTGSTQGFEVILKYDI